MAVLKIAFLLLLSALICNEFVTAENVGNVGPVFAADDCFKPTEYPKLCRASKRVFKWDHEKSECVQAFYGGCHKTNNNFKTLDLCREIAEPVCRTVKEVENPPPQASKV